MLSDTYELKCDEDGYWTFLFEKLILGAFNGQFQWNDKGRKSKFSGIRK